MLDYIRNAVASISRCNFKKPYLTIGIDQKLNVQRPISHTKMANNSLELSCCTLSAARIDSRRVAIGNGVGRGHRGVEMGISPEPELKFSVDNKGITIDLVTYLFNSLLYHNSLGSRITLGIHESCIQPREVIENRDTSTTCSIDRLDVNRQAQSLGPYTSCCKRIKSCRARHLEAKSLEKRPEPVFPGKGADSVIRIPRQAKSFSHIGGCRRPRVCGIGHDTVDTQGACQLQDTIPISRGDGIRLVGNPVAGIIGQIIARYDIVALL